MMDDGSRIGRGDVWKVVINGHAGVGKSSLLLRFTADTFSEQKAVTLPGNEEFMIKEIKNIDKSGKDMRLQIYDTAGQEKFRTITSSYYRGAAGAMLVYDSSNENSFNSLKGWLDDLDRYLPDVPRVIIANKIDLSEVVEPPRGEEFAKQAKAPFFRTSAKTGEG